MKKALFIALLAVVPIAHGQAANPSIVLVSTAPSGSCGNGLPDQQVLSTGLIYSCQSGTWGQIGTGGSVGSAVTFNNSGTGGASGSTFTGSAPLTVSYNTIGASGPASVSAVGGDLACAVANDLTINSHTITSGSSTASTITVGGAAGFATGYYVGGIINVQGVSPAGFNAVNQVIASISGNTVTYTNSTNPGAWSSGGTISKYCSNQASDGIAATPVTFANKYTYPANWFSAGQQVDAQANFLIYTPSANAAAITGIKLGYAGGATIVYQNRTALAMALNAGITAFGGMLDWSINGLSSNSAIFNLKSTTFPSTSTLDFWGNSAANAQPVSNLNLSSNTLQTAIWWAATGVASGLTYVSGGTISGSQTCTLATFNNSCSGTTANIVITSGTPGAITMTARGAACTAAPTTATIAGTNCTGTVTLSGGVLGGSPGNAVEMLTFSVK